MTPDRLKQRCPAISLSSTVSIVERLTCMQEVWSSNPGLAKSHTVLQTVRHRFASSSKSVHGDGPRKLVTRFGEPFTPIMIMNLRFD